MIARLLLRAVVVTGAIALGGCGSGGQPPTLPSEDVCAVSSVIDGDSLNCVDGRRMRLLLIDAPEMAQVPFGDQARLVLLDLAPLGTELSVEYDVDRRGDFGRDLTYLWLPDGTMVNEAMAALGYAVALVIPPNGRYEERIRAAVAEASEAGRGLWADWKFACLPVDFRAGRC
ncbi:MAG: thermonuclease family protein [Longimicrobiales bacterium]